MSEKEKATTHPLSFEELSDKAQARALADYEPFTDWDWSQDSVEHWYSKMEEEYGISGDDMEWDDSFSPWFKGKVDDNEKFIRKVAPGLIEKAENRFMQIEYGLDPNFYEDMWIAFSHYPGRNPSSRSMQIEIEDADDVADEIFDEIEKRGKQAIIDELQKFGGELQREWDYMFSEEAAREYFDWNDMKFNPDGSVYQ